MQEELVRRTTKADNQTELEYFVYPATGTEFRRALVYLHGLVSDINWFRVPENLPPETAIVFLPRQPRIQVDHYSTWTRNYELCLLDYQRQHRADYYHLVAQCFGVMPGTHWAATRPETFDTLTLACPPIEMKQEFTLLEKLKIALGPKGGLQHCKLTPRSYGRTPSLVRFIEENPTTRFEFTNSLYRQTHALRQWVRKAFVAFSAPTQAVVTTEDAVAEPTLSKNIQRALDRVTVLRSDHFCELLPSGKEFWKTIFEFQQSHESRYEFSGEIESVLVTGATGFLGSHIVRRLHADGKRVLVFARNVGKALEMFADLGQGVSVHEGNLDDLPSLDAAIDAVDAVVHTAGHVSDWDDYATFANINVEGTKNILMLAHEKGLKQFVHISSLGVFGDTDQDNIDENNAYRWSSDHYSNSKITSEIEVRKYCMINRIPFAIVRPGFIYGEGDNNFVPKLIDNLRAKKVKYIGSRENIVNTVYVGNVAELVAKTLGNPDSFGETYNIADPQHTSAGQFIGDIASGLGLDPPTKLVPKALAFTAATVFERVFRILRMKTPPPLTRKKVTFVGRSRSVNASKAYAFIGREPYSYTEGMTRTLAGLKDTAGS